MKKLFFMTYILTFLCTINAFAAQTDYFDDNGRLYKRDWGEYHNIYTYDENGHTIKQDQFYTDGSVRNGFDVSETYNEDGTLAVYNVISRWDGHLVQRVNYEYDTQGNLINEIVYQNDRGNMPLLKTTTYSYDENGVRTSFLRKDASNNIIEQGIYQYDDYGNITAAYDPTTNQPVWTYRYTDTFLANKAAEYAAAQAAAQASQQTSHSGRRIYTVEEARQAVEAAGTDTVNFRIRYK